MKVLDAFPLTQLTRSAAGRSGRNDAVTSTEEYSILMRRILQLSMLCVGAGVLSACSPEEIIETDEIPTAGVRFINAVPDTGAMDFRFVDDPENSAHWNVAFRNNPVTSAGITASTLVQYKPTQTGQRHLRIFMNGTTAAVASTVVKDTVVTLEPGKNYTALLWGSARGGAYPMRLAFYEEAVADPGTQVALRVINATEGAVDASYYVSTGAPPGAAIATNLAPLTRSDYVLAAPARYRFNVRSAGTTSPIIMDALAIAGEAATTSGAGPFDAIPGTSIAGSAVTAIVFPVAVPGSQAPPFSITTGNTSALSATGTGYSRQAGSFGTDGFFVGQEVTATGYLNPANNGTSIVTAIGEPSSTTTLLSATATGYARATGSFLTDGYRVGQTITASGFTNAANNGRSVVTAVTATALTVTKTGGTVAEAAGTTNRTITGDGTMTVANAGGTALEAGTTGPITLAASATGYTRTSGSFIDDGFLVGQTIGITGFTSQANNGLAVITAITATDVTVTKQGGPVAEAAGANRVIANAELRRINGVVGRMWSFIWDRRPGRPSGV
jgi:uncharacterized protein DUF4397